MKTQLPLYLFRSQGVTGTFLSSRKKSKSHTLWRNVLIAYRMFQLLLA